MILAIDIGNTNIVLGCVEGKKTFFIERLSTDKAKTELEYAVSLKNVLEIYEIPVDQIEGGIISAASRASAAKRRRSSSTWEPQLP